MGDELVARRRTVRSFAWVLLGAALGCATSSAESVEGTAGVVQPPQQVVQRVMPAEPAPEAAQRSVRAAEPTSGSDVVRQTRSAPRGGTISSKHLEAELNRLEAELRR
jgi:hypothetical protein